MARGTPRVACVAALVALAGCGYTDLDPKADHDDLVGSIWLEDFEKQDAVEFLEAGGTVYGISRDDLLPFARDLKQQGHQSWVLRDELAGDSDGWVMVVKLPLDPSARSKIDEGVQSLKSKPNQGIEAEWGYEYLSLAFDAEMAEEE